MAYHLEDLKESPRSHDLAQRRVLMQTMGLFLVVTLLAISDVVIDLAAGASPAHVAWESTILLAGAVGVVFLVFQLRAAHRGVESMAERAEELAEALHASRVEADRWREEARDALDGLGRAIDRQFERWSLTPAEREVAMLLLKGLSHKEIAEIRGVGVATARQQAQAAYRKAGLSGRADLAAFFLEDLLLPGPSNPDDAG